MSASETAGPAQAMVIPTADAEPNVATCLIAGVRPVTAPRASSGASACTREPVTANMAVIAPSVRATNRNAAASHTGVGLSSPAARAADWRASVTTSRRVASRSNRAGQIRVQARVTKLVPASAPKPAPRAISQR